MTTTPVEALRDELIETGYVGSGLAHQVARDILLELDDIGWRLERRTPATPSFRDWERAGSKRRDAGDGEPVIGLDVADQTQLALGELWGRSLYAEGSA